METLKVFISETMRDLRGERQIGAEAIEAIGSLQWKSVMAESHGSQLFSLRGVLPVGMVEGSAGCIT